MNPDRYNKNLEWLLSQKPNHPLRSTLERGYSRINTIYLQKALEKLTESPTEEPKAEPSTVHRPPSADKKDPVREQLLATKRGLLNDRNKLSNKMHAQTLDERISTSKQILIIQRQIKKTNHRLNYYDEHGELPDKSEKARFPLPDSALGIQKKIYSLRAMICQEKNKLDDLAPSGDTAAIDKSEKRLAHLQNYLTYAENALEEKESA